MEEESSNQAHQSTTLPKLKKSTERAASN